MQPHPKRWLILGVILAAECMDLLDSTIVNVAAPSIHSSLHASSTALQWIVGGYPLALAVGLLIGGRLGDLFGRRTVFLFGVGGFVAASAVCGLAVSTDVLVCARLAQGLAGAAMLPQGLGLLRQAFGREEITKAFALFGPVMGSAALLGPIIGGGLVSLHITADAWRPVFLINLPIGLGAAVAAARLLPKTEQQHASALDLVGAGIAALASLALIYPLVQGRTLGWPAWTFVSIGASVVLFALLGVHLNRRKAARRDPLIEPRVFTRRGYAPGALLLMLYFGGMVGGMLALTLYLQVGEHFSAVHAGLTTAPFSLGVALTAPIASGLMEKGHARSLVQAGTALSIVGYGTIAIILGQTASVSSWGLLPGLLVVGLGMGLFIVPVFGTIIGDVADDELGSASGALNAVQQFGGAIGVAALGAVFFAAIPGGGFAGALRDTTWWQVGALAGVLVLSPLLPRSARPEADLLLEGGREPDPVEDSAPLAAIR